MGGGYSSNCEMSQKVYIAEQNEIEGAEGNLVGEEPRQKGDQIMKTHDYH